MSRGWKGSRLGHVSSDKMEKGLCKLVFGGALAVGLFLGGRAYTDIQQGLSSGANKSKIDVPAIIIEQTDVRQALLNTIFAEVKPEHLSRVIYDTDGTKREEHFKQQLLRVGQSIAVGNIKTSHYDTAIFGLNDEIGSGSKSTFFVGTALFDRGYSEDDWRNVVRRGNRYAEVQAKGFNGVSPSELIGKIRSGEIPIDFFYRLRELDADAFGLHDLAASNLSSSCASDLILKVEGTRLWVQEIYPALNPDVQGIVDRISSPYGIKYDNSEIRLTPVNKKSKKPISF